MIMEEIMNSRDQDHLMQQVKIVDTKILGNLMIKEATVKKGKKNLPNPYTYVNIFVSISTVGSRFKKDSGSDQYIS